MLLLLAELPISGIPSKSTITKGVVSFKICLIRKIKTLLQKQISQKREAPGKSFITESFLQGVKICLGVH